MKSLSRLSMVAVLALAIGAMAGPTACSKEESKSAEAPEGGDEKSGDEAEAKSGDDAKEGGTKAAAATGAAKRPASRPAMAMPEDVLGVAGASSFKELVQSAVTASNKIAPGQVPPNAASLALEGLKAALGLTDVTWLDQDKPIRFFSANPKLHAGKGQTVVAPIADKEKVLASLKPEAEKGKDGHAAVFEHQFQTFYVDFVDGHVVVTDAAPLFGQYKTFITDTLLEWTPERPISIRFNVDNINRIFGPEIDEGKANLTAMMAQVGQEPGVPDSREVLELQIAMLFSLLETTSRASVDVWLRGDDVQLAIGVRPKAGSALATFTKTIEGKTSRYADALPNNAYLAAAANTDTRKIESLQQLSRKSMEMYAKYLKLSDEDLAKLGTIIDKANAQATGESAVALHQDGPFPMAISGLMVVEDSAETRKIYGELVSLLFDKGFALLKAEMAKEGTEIPPGVADAKSLPELVTVVGGLLGAFGVKLELIAQDADGVKVDGLAFEADWDKLGIQEKDPETYEILKNVLGNKVQVAFAYKGKTMGVGFGPNGQAMARDMANGKRAGGEPTLNKANPGNAFAMTIRMDLAMKAVSFIPDLAPMADKIAALPKGRSFTLTGASNGSEAVFTLGVPMDVVAGLVALAQ